MTAGTTPDRHPTTGGDMSESSEARIVSVTASEADDVRLPADAAAALGPDATMTLGPGQVVILRPGGQARKRGTRTMAEVIAASGARPVASRNANARRASGADPPSLIERSANLRAASTKVGSFSSVRACSGVLVVARRTTQTSRFGASNTVIVGCGRVRFQ